MVLTGVGHRQSARKSGIFPARKARLLRIAFQVPAGVSVTEADLVAANSPRVDPRFLGLDAAGQHTTVCGADFVTRLRVIPGG